MTIPNSHLNSHPDAHSVITISVREEGADVVANARWNDDAIPRAEIAVFRSGECAVKVVSRRAGLHVPLTG